MRARGRGGGGAARCLVLGDKDDVRGLVEGWVVYGCMELLMAPTLCVCVCSCWWLETRLCVSSRQLLLMAVGFDELQPGGGEGDCLIYSEVSGGEGDCLIYGLRR